MWLDPMFERQGPEAGLLILLVGAVVWLAGFLWLRRILDVRTEASAFRATADRGRLTRTVLLVVQGLVVAGVVVLALLVVVPALAGLVRGT